MQPNTETLNYNKFMTEEAAKAMFGVYELLVVSYMYMIS